MFKHIFFPHSKCFVNLMLKSHNFSNYSKTKDWLKSFGGGRIYLEKFTDDVTKLLFDNKEAHNSFTGLMMTQLDDCLDILEKEPPKVLLVSSKEGSFCSGGHLKFVKVIANHDDGDRMCSYMQSLTDRISRLPSLSVAIIEGVAFGGGAEITVCCDLRFMASNAKISFKQKELGVTPGWGGAYKLIQLLGKQEAFKLLLSAEVIKANDALSRGLVDVVLVSNSAKERYSEAVRWLDNWLKGTPKDVLFSTKKLIYGLLNSNSKELMDIERDIFRSVWGGASHLKALENINKN